MIRILTVTLLLFASVGRADEIAELTKKLEEAKAKAVATVKVDSSNKIVDHLQDVSVTISTSKSEGSGVIKTRTRGKDSINFIWTGAHVVEDLRKVNKVVDGKSGSEKTVIRFNDVNIIKHLKEDGRDVGKVEMLARVIKYDAEADLAVLQVRKKNFVATSVQFYLDENVPDIGTELIHVGSLLGERGSNSMTKGILSQQGRIIDGEVFDQTTAPAFPGSSGGGMYLAKDGRLIGLLLRGAGEAYNFIAPTRRIVEWSKKVNMEWALNDSVPLPDDKVIRSIPVEDNGEASIFLPPIQFGSPQKLLYYK